MSKIIFSFMLLLLSLAVSAQENKVIDNNTVFSSDEVDVKPEFPDGIDALRKVVAKNYRIPKVTRNGAFKIYTSFIIEKDGSMTDVKVTNDADKELAAEAIRVLKAVKQKWTPAMKNGSPVKSSYVFPISINIQ